MYTRKIKKTKRAVNSQKRAFSVTKAIASKDHNNLYNTSSFFKDKTKFRGFCAFYAVMRIMDDRIDNLTPSIKQCEELKKLELSVVDAWEQIVISCHRGIYPTKSQLEACDFTEIDAICESLIAAFSSFPIPIELWTNFFEAMRSDLVAGEFDCWSDFLAYAEGATVAPTTIYLLLITVLSNNANNSYELPKGFDLFECGRYLGIFAYLGHIIRDLAEDVKSATTRLCITRKDMNDYGVSLEILKREALRGQASAETRDLVTDILLRAQRYLIQGRTHLSQIQDFLESDCRFILELIITLYEQIIAKIKSTGYDPMAKQHYLTRAEKVKIVKSVALQNGFPLPNWFGSQK